MYPECTVKHLGWILGGQRLERIFIMGDRIYSDVWFALGVPVCVACMCDCVFLPLLGVLLHVV